ncbi:KTSC domain-containing protein [Candidatus Poriferisocius sp.]|uniref:KTSC domain-containing protein n=1 Tax=Candidatus Poriferisocius sp. TaxID=3101276 RepID=UPI003B5AE1F7
MNRQQVSSSNIKAIGYDVPTETLEVEFLSGWVYQYYGVSQSVHGEFMKSQSKGRFLNQYIKNAYPYSRVG